MKAKFIAALIITASIVGVSQTAYANRTDAEIQDHYKEVVHRVPNTHRECRNVDVPVRRESFSQGKAVIGGIIGGIIGHNLGGKNNRHITTGFGTLAGSVIGGSENEVQGYRSETRCQNITNYDQQIEHVYSHSTVTFWEDGRKYTVKFTK